MVLTVLVWEINQYISSKAAASSAIFSLQELCWALQRRPGFQLTPLPSVGGHLYSTSNSFISPLPVISVERTDGTAFAKIIIASMSESARAWCRIKPKNAFFSGLEELVSELVSPVCHSRGLFGSMLVCCTFGVLLCFCFHAVILAIMRSSGNAEYHSTLWSQADVLLEKVRERRHLSWVMGVCFCRKTLSAVPQLCIPGDFAHQWHLGLHC